jgi:hypothetical protein
MAQTLDLVSLIIDGCNKYKAQTGKQAKFIYCPLSIYTALCEQINSEMRFISAPAINQEPTNFVTVNGCEVYLDINSPFIQFRDERKAFLPALNLVEVV